MTSSLPQLVAQALTTTGAAQTRAAARLMSVLENQPTRLPEVLQEIAGAKSEGRGTKDEGREEKREGRGTKNEGRQEAPAPVVHRPSSIASSSAPVVLRPSSISSPSLILGVTGSPGAGKSTLTDALVAEYRTRHPDKRVGVIAVDPSSPFTGGAVLGDRVRMMRHATDPRVFVRSMATRGHLGGLSLGVRGVLAVMSMIGCDLVIIETVGVGQSEVEIAGVADATAILFAPGQGDSIQLLKAGLMEIGDLFVVNKADRPGAEELHTQLLGALKLGAIDPPGVDPHHVGLPVEKIDAEVQPSAELGLMRSRPLPEVYLVSAVERSGLGKLVDGLEKLAADHRQAFLRRREQRVKEAIHDAILEEARARVQTVLGHNGSMSRQVQRVLDGKTTIGELATELLRKAGDDRI